MKRILSLLIIILIGFVYLNVSFSQVTDIEKTTKQISEQETVQQNIYRVEVVVGNNVEKKMALMKTLESWGLEKSIPQNDDKSIMLQLTEKQLAELETTGYEVTILKRGISIERRGGTDRKERAVVNMQTNALQKSARTASFVKRSGTNSSNYSIPDYSSTGVKSPITISGAPSGAVVYDIDLHYEIIHPCRSDLEVWLSNDQDTYRKRFRDDDASSCVANLSEYFYYDYYFSGKNVNQTWRLEAYDLYSGDIGYIDTWTIDVWYEDVPSPPSLFSPSNGSTQTSLPVYLSWNSVTGATEYWVQVSTNSSFTSLIKDQSTGSSTSYSLSSLTSGTTYYWRVKAKNAAGWSSYCSYWYFTYQIPLPPAPTLITPVNGSTQISEPINFSWYSVTGGTDYWLQVSTNSSFTSLVYDNSTSGWTNKSLKWDELRNRKNLF